MLSDLWTRHYFFFFLKGVYIHVCKEWTWFDSFRNTFCFHSADGRRRKPPSPSGAPTSFLFSSPGHLGQLKNPFISILPFLFFSFSFFWAEGKGPPTTSAAKRWRSFPRQQPIFVFFSGGLLLVLNISPDISRDNFQVLKQKRIRKIFFQEITGDMPPPPPWCNGSGSAIASNLIKEQWILHSTGRDKEAF